MGIFGRFKKKNGMTELPDDFLDEEDEGYERPPAKQNSDDAASSPYSLDESDDEYEYENEESPREKKRTFFGRKKKKKTPGNTLPERKEERGERAYVPSVNLTPFEWAKPIVGKAVDESVNRCVFKTFFVWFLFALVFSGLFGGAWFVERFERQGVVSRLEGQKNAIDEYSDIATSLASYGEFVRIINNPSLYAQFSGIAFLASRNGFLVEKTVFSNTPLSYVRENQFLIETGRNLKDVAVLGSWAITGTLSPRADMPVDDSWAMNFGRQAAVLFSKLGVSGAHTTLAVRPTSEAGSSTICVTLWK